MSLKLLERSADKNYLELVWAMLDTVNKHITDQQTELRTNLLQKQNETLQRLRNNLRAAPEGASSSSYANNKFGVRDGKKPAKWNEHTA